MGGSLQQPTTHNSQYNPAVIVLDGTYGEGGGALLRTALAMSALTEQAVKIENVRGETRHPGLDPEDLTLVNALVESTGAEATGASVGSNTLAFMPTHRPRALNGKLATVRSDSNRGPNALIVLNALLPVLAGAGAYSTLEGEGETYGGGALGYDAFAEETLAVLRKVGLHAFPDLVEAGFGRESRGVVSLDVEPSALTGLNWTERGRSLGLQGRVVTSGLPRDVGERAAAHLRRLAGNSGVEITAEARAVESAKPGLHVTVWAEYVRGRGGGAAMGGRGVQAETLAQAAFTETMEFVRSDGCLDAYLADQILVPLVLAPQESAVRISKLTQRFLTAVWVVKRFTPIRLTVRGSEGHAGLVTIER